MPHPTHAPPPQKRGKPRRWLVFLAVWVLLLVTDPNWFLTMLWWAALFWALAGDPKVAEFHQRKALESEAARKRNAQRREAWERRVHERAATSPPQWKPQAREPLVWEDPPRKPAPARKKTTRRKRKSPSLTRAVYRGAKKGYRMGRRSKLYGGGDGD